MNLFPLISVTASLLALTSLGQNPNTSPVMNSPSHTQIQIRSLRNLSVEATLINDDGGGLVGIVVILRNTSKTEKLAFKRDLQLPLVSVNQLHRAPVIASTELPKKSYRPPELTDEVIDPSSSRRYVLSAREIIERKHLKLGTMDLLVSIGVQMPKDFLRGSGLDRGIDESVNGFTFRRVTFTASAMEKRPETFLDERK